MLSEFEAVLHRWGISISPGSYLEQAALSVHDLVYRQAAGSYDTHSDIREIYRQVIGIREVAGLLVALRDHPEFSALVPHLRLLSLGSSLQNAASTRPNDPADKVFELLVALWVIQCGRELDLDHPEKQPSNNPDVLATINGERWGFACKVLHSLNPESFIQNLKKGIDQIERSSATTGIVVFNLKNVIRHEDYWKITNPEAVGRGEEPEFSAFLNPAHPFNMLLKETQMIGVRLAEYLPADYLPTVFEGKKTLPGFLLSSPTTSGVVLHGNPLPTAVRVMNLQELLPITGAARKVLDCIHDAAFLGTSESQPPGSQEETR